MTSGLQRAQKARRLQRCRQHHSGHNHEGLQRPRVSGASTTGCGARACDWGAVIEPAPVTYMAATRAMRRLVIEVGGDGGLEEN